MDTSIYEPEPEPQPEPEPEPEPQPEPEPEPELYYVDEYENIHNMLSYCSERYLTKEGLLVENYDIINLKDYGEIHNNGRLLKLLQNNIDLTVNNKNNDIELKSDSELLDENICIGCENNLLLNINDIFENPFDLSMNN